MRIPLTNLPFYTDTCVRGLLGLWPDSLSHNPLWKGSRTFPVSVGSNTGSPFGTGMFINSGGHPGVLESKMSNET